MISIYEYVVYTIIKKNVYIYSYIEFIRVYLYIHIIHVLRMTINMYLVSLYICICTYMMYVHYVCILINIGNTPRSKASADARIKAIQVEPGVAIVFSKRGDGDENHGENDDEHTCIRFMDSIYIQYVCIYIYISGMFQYIHTCIWENQIGKSLVYDESSYTNDEHTKDSWIHQWVFLGPWFASKEASLDHRTWRLNQPRFGFNRPTCRPNQSKLEDYNYINHIETMNIRNIFLMCFYEVDSDWVCT